MRCVLYARPTPAEHRTARSDVRERELLETRSKVAALTTSQRYGHRQLRPANRAAAALIVAITCIGVSIVLRILSPTRLWLAPTAGALLLASISAARSLLRSTPVGARMRFLLLFLVMLAIPVLKWRFPGNTCWADPPAVLLILYVALIALQRRYLVLPDAGLFGPVLVMMGSGVSALLASPSVPWGVYTLVQDAYLVLLWFAALNLSVMLQKQYGLEMPARWICQMWVAVAAVNALLVTAGMVGPSAVLDLLSYGSGSRGTGLFRDPNMAAHYLGASLFIAPIAVVRSKGRITRVAFAAAGMMLLIGVLATASNGAKVALSLAIAVVVGQWAVRSAGAGLWRAASLCGIGIALAIALFLITNSIVRMPHLQFENDRLRMSTFSSTLDERILGWQYALTAFRAYPFGAGPGTLGLPVVEPIFGSTEAHSDPLCYLAERGVIGALAYVCFVYAVLRRASGQPTVPRHAGRSAAVTYSLLGVFAFMFAMGLSVDSLHFRHLWFLLGALLSQGDGRAIVMRW